MSTQTDRLSGFRQRKDMFFKSNEGSPLTAEQREAFEHLNYFDESDALRLQVELDRSGEGIGEVVTIGTVSGEAKSYERAGRIHFESEGQRITLSVFKDSTRGHFFIPFRDTTAGHETYAVGRYLEPKALPNGRLSVDFNLAYNPYCAYNTGWSCPIPPFENRIDAPIRAGETNPHLPGTDMAH